MVSQPPQPSTQDALNRQSSKIQTQITDCQKVLAYIAQPEYQRIAEYHQGIEKPYMNLVQGVNTPMEIRHSSALCLDVCKKHTNIKLYFEKKLGDAQARLRKIEVERDRDAQSRKFPERIMSLIR